MSVKRRAVERRYAGADRKAVRGVTPGGGDRPVWRVSHLTGREQVPPVTDQPGSNG